EDVDPKRIAFVGHSYHASAGAILSGTDRRFKAFVLMAGSLSDEVDLQSKEEQEHRLKVGPEKYDAFVKKYAWINPGKYVAHAGPAFVFLQYGKEKYFTAQHIREYEKIVSEPKRLKIYDAPHALNAEARRDRIQFLTEQLKLRPLPTSLIPKMLTETREIVPIIDGKMQLGTWQEIFLFEHRRAAHRRKISVTIIGE